MTHCLDGSSGAMLVVNSEIFQNAALRTNRWETVCVNCIQHSFERICVLLRFT